MPAEERHLQGPLVSIWLPGFSPSSTKEPSATSMHLPWLLECLFPLCPGSLLYPAIPGHSNVQPTVTIKSAWFLIKGYGWRTPHLQQEMGERWSKVICLGQKNSPQVPAGDRWKEDMIIAFRSC